MFQSVLPAERFFQVRNMARTYRPRYAYDFARPSTRAEEVFRASYNQTVFAPKVISLFPSEPKSAAGMSLAFCYKNFQLTTLFRTLSDELSPAASARAGNFAVNSYDRIFGAVASRARGNRALASFDRFTAHLIKFSIRGRWFEYSSNTPLWFKLRALKSFRRRCFFTDRLSYKERAHLAISFANSRGLLDRQFSRRLTSRRLARRILEPAYNADDHLLESELTAAFIFSAARLPTRAKHRRLLSLSRASRKPRFSKRKKRLRLVRRGRLMASGYRVFKQAILPSGLVDFARDFREAKEGLLLGGRKKMRRFMRKRRGRRSAAARGFVLPYRRLKSPRRRRLSRPG